MIKPTERLTKIYNDHGEAMHNLHSLLWQILINEQFIDKIITLAVLVEDWGYSIGIAEKGTGGYTPTPTHFKSGTEYHEAVRICNAINYELFGQSEKESLQIVLPTLTNKPHDNET